MSWARRRRRAAGKSDAELAAIAEINSLADRPAFLAWKRRRRP